MKTTAEYQLKEKKRKLYVPSIKKLNINIYDEMSEKLKVKKKKKKTRTDCPAYLDLAFALLVREM